MWLLVIIVVILILCVMNLYGRVRALEEMLDKKNSPQEVKRYEERTPLQPAAVAQAQTVAPVYEQKSVDPDWWENFVIWMKDDWLLKLGAMLLLIGFGWLATYAFLNNWIGPAGRIALGVIAGALFLILGWWRIQKYLHQGGVFMVVGSTTILLTLFAAREYYNFFSPLSALGIMFLSTAFVALASVKYRSKPLALGSLILASIAPLLTGSPSPDYIGLFSYLLVVILGVIWVVGVTGWRELNVAALILVFLYSVPHLTKLIVKDEGTLLLFAYVFATIFFIFNTTAILKNNKESINPDLLAAAGSGLLLLAWILLAATPEWKSLIISAWMVVFGAGAFLVFRVTGRREPFYVYAGVGIAMLAAATSAELHGASLTIAYTIESGIISLVSYYILRDVKVAERLSLLLVGPAMLSFSSVAAPSWNTGIWHKDFFVLLVLAMTIFGLGLIYLEKVRELKDEESRQFNIVLLYVGSAYAYTLLWLSLHAAFLDDQAAMVALVAYTVIGLVAHFFGIALQKNSLKVYGGIMLGLVVVRLMIVDVWKMEMAGRIVTFFLIGALLVSTAFLSKNKSIIKAKV